MIPWLRLDIRQQLCCKLGQQLWWTNESKPDVDAIFSYQYQVAYLIFCLLSWEGENILNFLVNQLKTSSPNHGKHCSLFCVGARRCTKLPKIRQTLKNFKKQTQNSAQIAPQEMRICLFLCFSFGLSNDQGGAMFIFTWCDFFSICHHSLLINIYVGLTHTTNPFQKP